MLLPVSFDFLFKDKEKYFIVQESRIVIVTRMDFAFSKVAIRREDYTKVMDYRPQEGGYSHVKAYRDVPPKAK